ncbi:NADH dehydrogenase subunit 5 (mitochondrion) [Gekko japonicus]|uniref:NADH-ubiquinone oxidoreductase chain 5 n=1 Tax=Gekko japonicus TaxID=146911 RepID=A0A0U2HA70_GEKJA|nr:NADH dehydrogenase subunit 5 [Gekko japonicus]ALE66012.1 NADH dehydrogenase subunit 5 [Gekko japonicus]
MANLLFHATLITTAIVLTTPLLFSHSPNTTNITATMKLATMISTLPLILFTSTGMQSITTNLNWINMNFNLQISFTFDTYAVLFLPVALLITWSILEFTNWYMASDPNHYKFSKYLLLFLIAMLTLTTANNMLQLFIGWEGVGIMSFLLISWWHARTNANTAALQAIIYNRIGDIGLILSITWLAMNFDTWEMQQMFAHTTVPSAPLLGLILAAAGKSAQFGLHPWLPAAMEGPTPVSALLHSSTMVVAGVFLLIRFHPLLEANPLALSSCLCLGALTTTFAALCALTQNDIKKIIAFSTTSQLGLMMLTIGLNQPELAFLHITTHAFFKAMLFLCSGSIIHNLNDEQDIRKMGGVQKTMPITTSCTTLGSLALMGTPFLAGFYTKDLIIETMNTSALNAWALLTTVAATALTAAYSLRLVFYVQLDTPRYLSWNRPNEAHSCQVAPILRLAAGSILAGLLVTSIILPNKTQIMTMTTITKLCASMVTLLGLICALDLTWQTTQMKPQNKTISHTTLTQLMFFNTLSHRTSPKMSLTLAQLSLLSNDTLWYETVGPTTVKKTNMALANKLSSTNSATIKTYLMTFITTSAATLLWLKL